MWQIRKPKDQVSPEEVAERTEDERRLMTTGDAGAFATTNELHSDAVRPACVDRLPLTTILIDQPP